MEEALFSRIESLLKSRGRMVIAIDGNSGAGKTTLAGLLADRYKARVFHGDDYFPRPGQPAAQRLPGGNLDLARFMEEVIAPIREDRDGYVRRFDCRTGKLQDPRHIPYAPITIVEGSYCLHPALGPYYDLALFLKAEPGSQRARLQSRYDAARFQRAMEEWVPRENAYFQTYNIPAKCDFVFTMA